MGAWGTDVNENDVFADIYDSFYEIYNEGADPLEASQLVRQIHEYDFDDEDLSVDAYLALALCQWETGVLRPELLDRVKVIVEEGKDSPLWLEADAATRKDRSEKLSAFLAKISVPTSEPKKRQKRKFDFQQKDLVKLVAPDGRKTFTVSASYVNGEYQNTTAMLMWETGGGGIFSYRDENARLSAEWITESKLIVRMSRQLREELAGIDLEKAGYYDDLVEIIYELE